MIRPLRAIAIDARIDASPADVWQALTKDMADWFAPHVKIGEGVGAVFEFSWDGTNKWPTKVEIWNPEKNLRFADDGPPGEDGSPGPQLMVDWFISTESGQTVLRLVNSGFGTGSEWDDQIDGITGGWRYFMLNLELCVTRHRGVHRVMVSARPRVKLQRDAFWDGLFTSGFITMDRAASVPARATITLGDRSYDAIVEMNDPGARLALKIAGLNDSLLFIEVEGKKPADFFTGFWLSTYGLPSETVNALQASLDATVARLIEPGVAAAL